MKPYLHISKSIVDTTLAIPALQGVRLLEPFKSFTLASGAPIKILEESNANGDAEAHEKEADLWLCLEGTPTFTLGGVLRNSRKRVAADGTLVPDELVGENIEGGDEIVLMPGEWLWIPTGVPHQHRSFGTMRMAIIKIPQT